MAQTTITISRLLLDRARAFARAEDRSLSNYLERLLKQHFAATEPAKRGTQIRKGAKS